MKQAICTVISGVTLKGRHDQAAVCPKEAAPLPRVLFRLWFAMAGLLLLFSTCMLLWEDNGGHWISSEGVIALEEPLPVYKNRAETGQWATKAVKNT